MPNHGLEQTPNRTGLNTNTVAALLRPNIRAACGGANAELSVAPRLFPPQAARTNVGVGNFFQHNKPSFAGRYTGKNSAQLGIMRRNIKLKAQGNQVPSTRSYSHETECCRGHEEYHAMAAKGPGRILALATINANMALAPFEGNTYCQHY